MAKTIIKEICIMLLLCIAIVLILGVIFYEYIPSNKAIPNQLEAYITPENIQAEIDEQVVELENLEVSYEVTSADLALYQQSRSYTSGKTNPFSTSTTVPENGENTTNNNDTNSNDSNINTSGTSNTAVDPNSTGTFYNNKGLK